MIYVLFNKGLPVHVTKTSPYTGTPVTKVFKDEAGKVIEYDEIKDSGAFKTFEEVEGLALYLTAMTGETYLAADAGESTLPRFSVFTPPKVGDEVSYGFNGDYYPCGKITKITKGWRIYTEDAKRFNRRKNTAGWVMVGGTWGLVAGHVEKRNPHF